jgi:Sulfotransferase family
MAAAFVRTARRKKAAGANIKSPSARRRARAGAGDRLLTKPVFVLSSIRSGSTLLRVMLNTHSHIYAPHELHLSGLKVQLRNRYVTSAMEELGLDADTLQYLLWDRLLHRELLRQGKRILVNKTPSDALMWRRIVECWPDARFIFLLRHPAAVTDSWQRARKDWTRDQVAEDVLRYMVALEEARTARGGLTVRYEELTTEPERETRRICQFLNVAWEPKMLQYGEGNHGKFRAGLGDWSPRIKSGTIQPAKPPPPPDQIPPALVDISTRWGYLKHSSAPEPEGT